MTGRLDALILASCGTSPGGIWSAHQGAVMDDVSELAAQAIGVVATHLGDVASGVAQRVKDGAADQLFRLVSDRLRSNEIGAAVLRHLEERPGAAGRQQMAASALAEEAAADEKFAVQLRSAVSAAVVVTAQVWKARRSGEAGSPKLVPARHRRAPGARRVPTGRTVITGPVHPQAHRPRWFSRRLGVGEEASRCRTH